MTAASAGQQHPLVAPLAFLLGVWEGEGRGLWVSEPEFRYRERIEMTHEGTPHLAYRQVTATPDGARSLHAEAGYLRARPEGTVEMVVAQATGLVEVHSGSVAGQRIELRARSVGRTPTALAVTEVTRVLEVTASVLSYRVGIAMHDEQVAPHLEARLWRVG